MKHVATAKIAAVLKQHEHRLLRKSHVVGVGIGEKDWNASKPGADRRFHDTISIG